MSINLYSSTFINTALTLWAWRVSEDPKHPIDSYAFTESANAHPLPFRVVFEPRMDRDELREGFEAYGM